jgi:hypothetical protein
MLTVQHPARKAGVVAGADRPQPLAADCAAQVTAALLPIHCAPAKAEICAAMQVTTIDGGWPYQGYQSISTIRKCRRSGLK